MRTGECAQNRSNRVEYYGKCSFLLERLLGGRWCFLIFWRYINKPGIVALDYLLSLLSILCCPGNWPIFGTVGKNFYIGLSTTHSVADPVCLCIKSADPVIERFLLLRMRC